MEDEKQNAQPKRAPLYTALYYVISTAWLIDGANDLAQSMRNSKFGLSQKVGSFLDKPIVTLATALSISWMLNNLARTNRKPAKTEVTNESKVEEASSLQVDKPSLPISEPPTQKWREAVNLGAEKQPSQLLGK